MDCRPVHGNRSWRCRQEKASAGIQCRPHHPPRGRPEKFLLKKDLLLQNDTSSATSLRTHSSNGSPGSMKPAMQEYIPVHNHEFHLNFWGNILWKLKGADTRGVTRLSDQEERVCWGIADADNSNGSGCWVKDCCACRAPKLEKVQPSWDLSDSYDAPAPAMEMVRGEPHLAQNLVDLLQVSRDQPLLGRGRSNVNW